jgi:demethylmenaquinone methyltransferase/2-methoxy-6-polyprenyl-1,4-benzoquinol methylase
MTKPTDPNQQQTHFGYEQVTPEEKNERVRGVFDSVANRYDIMNDLMSLGLHRGWKRYAVQSAQIQPGQAILDLAGGTGDITALMAKQLGKTGHLVLADINHNMVVQGRERLLNKGLCRIDYAIANAEQLPFPDNYFHRVTIGFGLRNVTHKELALQEIFRTLRPGGRLLVLEFSKPNSLLQPFYDAYSFKLVPKIGQWITGDRDSYQYLVESIRMHPDQPHLASMLSDCGFYKVNYENLSGGVVALHTGYKT